jgi:hypothetical protein
MSVATGQLLMRLKEITAPNSATPHNPEADAIKRQQQELGDRKARLDVQTTQEKLSKQRQKLSALSSTGKSVPKNVGR